MGTGGSAIKHEIPAVLRRMEDDSLRQALSCHGNIQSEIDPAAGHLDSAIERLVAGGLGVIDSSYQRGEKNCQTTV